MRRPSFAAPSRRATQGRIALSTFTSDAVAQLPGPDWLRTRRAAALARFEEAPLPTEEDEVWRFTNISSFRPDRYTPAAASPGTSGIPEELRPVIDAVRDPAAVVVTHNGWLRHVEVRGDRGLRIGGVEVLGDEAPDTFASTPVHDAFGELADAFVAEPVVIAADEGVAVERPVLVLHWFDADAGAAFPRVIVRTAPASEVTVLDHYASPDVASYIDPVVDLSAADASVLRYLSVQDLGPRVWQTAYQSVRAARDATVTTAAVALGGEYARLRLDTRLTGEGGSARLLAVYFGEDHQLHDFRTLQDHEAPNTTSELLFKGAVVDEAHSVYTGMIRVQKGAVGTAATQTNRNLVLSEGARADSVPNLEILENNLRNCAHASATGPIDEEQQFYLEARGVPTAIAERLIVLGFFDDVLQRLPVEGVRELLRVAVAKRLEAVMPGA